VSRNGIAFRCHAVTVSGMRVHELARVLGISSRELLDRLRADGEWTTSHMSRVPDPHVQRLTAALPDVADALPRTEHAIPVSSSGPFKSPERPLFRAVPHSFWRKRRRGPAKLTLADSPSVDDYDDRIRYGQEMTTRDVANRLGVTQATVRMWVRRGHITPTGRYKNSNVFDTEAVLSAHEAIRSRTKPVPPDPSLVRQSWLIKPSVNIPARYHNRIVSVREAAALAQVRPATIRTWIHRGHLHPVPVTESREVRLRVGDVFRAARRRRV
jgi:DNA-binding transcriptional MerR regulator